MNKTLDWERFYYEGHKRNFQNRKKLKQNFQNKET